MTLWEFSAVVQGWSKAQPGAGDKSAPPTEEEHDRLMAKYA